MEEAEVKTCHNCAYKQNVPGDAHIACSFNFKAAKLPIPQGDPHGIANGWYSFPINYDPNWMRDECQGFATESDPALVIAPFESLLLLMRG